MGYACFTEDGNAAAILATNLETGDVIGVCGEHIVDYSLGLLQSASGLTWVPVTDDTDPATGEASDDEEGEDGPTVPDAAPAELPTGTPSLDDKPDIGELTEDDGDQLAEDGAVRDAELREELTGRKG